MSSFREEPQPMDEMQYEDRDGLLVSKDGPVVIDGVLHRVKSFYVACEPGLNRRAWNVTMFAATCPICYPDAKECRTSDYVQGELAL